MSSNDSGIGSVFLIEAHLREETFRRKKDTMRRILYAALAGLVFILAVLVGTVISAVLLNGVEF
jgi:hypothetical protein